MQFSSSSPVPAAKPLFLDEEKKCVERLIIFMIDNHSYIPEDSESDEDESDPPSERTSEVSEASEASGVSGDIITGDSSSTDNNSTGMVASRQDPN